ncbi:MAG: glycine cleavage system protein R [Verrucomicrobia bacterium]|nr:glycine cleavage system protein R [Verrucomicrobiota bacterium]
MTIILTLVGPDRTGIVEEVSHLLVMHGGNWLESRFCRLGGHFAGILRADIPLENRDALHRAFDSMRGGGFEIQLREGSVLLAAQAMHFAHLEVVGGDRPGIVRQISQILARLAVNVEDFESGCESAAMSGHSLFSARATLALPPQVSVETLRSALEGIADDLMVTVRPGAKEQGPG